MNVNALEKKGLLITKLIRRSDEIIEELENLLDYRDRKLQIMDNLSDPSALINNTDKILASKSKIDNNQSNNLYLGFLQDAKQVLDIDRLIEKQSLIKEMSFDIKDKKLSHAQLDLDLRLQKIEQENQINDIKKIKRHLFLELGRVRRDINLLD